MDDAAEGFTFLRLRWICNWRWHSKASVQTSGLTRALAKPEILTCLTSGVLMSNATVAKDRLQPTRRSDTISQ